MRSGTPLLLAGLLALSPLWSDPQTKGNAAGNDPAKDAKPRKIGDPVPPPRFLPLCGDCLDDWRWGCLSHWKCSACERAIGAMHDPKSCGAAPIALCPDCARGGARCAICERKVEPPDKADLALLRKLDALGEVGRAKEIGRLIGELGADAIGRRNSAAADLRRIAKRWPTEAKPALAAGLASARERDDLETAAHCARLIEMLDRRMAWGDERMGLPACGACRAKWSDLEILHAADARGPSSLGHWPPAKGCAGCGTNVRCRAKHAEGAHIPTAAFCLACASKRDVCAICRETFTPPVAGDDERPFAWEWTVCPACGRWDAAVPVVYGLPDKEMEARAEKGEILLGGCLVPGKPAPDPLPLWHCKACKKRW